MNQYSFVKAMNHIVGLPAKERHLKIHEQFADLNKLELLQVICALTDVAVDYTQSCDEAVWLHLIGKGDYHPDRVDNLNLPSLAGSLNGLLLDELAPVKKGLCATCAYRRGTLGNSSTSTQADVDYAFLMNTSFSCHKQVDQAGEINNEIKSCLKPCKGWIQHKKYLEKQIMAMLNAGEEKEPPKCQSEDLAYQSGDLLLCLYDYKKLFLKNCHYQVINFGDELNVVTEDESCETVPLSELPSDLFRSMGAWETFLVEFHADKYPM